MKWLDIAHDEMGVAEVAGLKSNPRILEYAKAAGYKPAKGDDDPWCGTFSAWVCVQAGIKPPDAPWRAVSWDAWGTASKLRKGAFVRFPRGNDPSKGHVGIVEREAGDWVYVLGGNQNDAVSIAKFRKSAVVSCRWPPGVAPPVPAPVAAIKSSRTITGVLLGGLGLVVQYLSSGVQIAMDAAAQMVQWAPATELFGTLGLNSKTVGFGMAAAGLLLSAYARLDAAAKGKEG